MGVVSFQGVMFLKHLGNLWKWKGYWSNVSLEDKFQRDSTADLIVVLTALSW